MRTSLVPASWTIAGVMMREPSLTLLQGGFLAVDLVGVCGYYMLVSMTLNVFEMPLPPGEPEPLA